ncbi:hypothetical protein BVRB_1g004670 [Beta vulgaris subsp. vulgaris]|nr:hypothetical protein BVRB_1g004670 [Beta vulgaris subsp. vulgaris]
MTSGRPKSAEEKKPSKLSDAEILRKCLEDNKGDKTKCKSKIEAFKFAATSPPSPKQPPSQNIFLRSGSLTDV